MASPTTQALRAAIKTKLDGLSTPAFVYDYHEEQLAGYPAVTFDLSDREHDFLTNKENLRAIAFVIVIWQELTIAGQSEATRILDNAVDEIVDAFENDYNLGAIVDWCEPVKGPRGQLPSPAGPVEAQELTLVCNFTHLTP